MDRSYRLRMENKLNDGILTVDIIASCIAKNELKINKLAYGIKRYSNYNNNTFVEDDRQLKLDELIAYRQPFVDVLIKRCHMSLDEVKSVVDIVKEKNIPTKAVIDKVRVMLISGNYWLDS